MTPLPKEALAECERLADSAGRICNPDGEEIAERGMAWMMEYLTELVWKDSGQPIASDKERRELAIMLCIFDDLVCTRAEHLRRQR